MKELVNVFAGNPLLWDKRNHVDPRALHELLADETVKAKGGARLLPVCDGKPLVVPSRHPAGKVSWSLAWQPIQDFGTRVPIRLGSILDDSQAGLEKSVESESGSEYDRIVYLGEKDGIPLFAIDVSSAEKDGKGKIENVAALFNLQNHPKAFFVDLRTLMTAVDWAESQELEELSIAGHARAITEWHKVSLYCGRCGTQTVPIEAGVRRQCANPSCENKSYPRVDPVVIMLIIDRDRDMAILSRQPRFPARMWTCLAGFLEAGETLEEAVKRETYEEVGIRVGETVYHSSQPWPVGRFGMPCQLMVGFFGFAETFDIRVDKMELEDAKWCTREQVRQALPYAEYKMQQETTALQIFDAASGGAPMRRPEIGLSGEGTSMAVPGPYAIAHNLIATWVNQGPETLLSKV